MIDISRTCSLTRGPIKLTTKIDKYFGLSLFGSSDVSAVPFENSDQNYNEQEDETDDITIDFCADPSQSEVYRTQMNIGRAAILVISRIPGNSHPKKPFYCFKSR